MISPKLATNSNDGDDIEYSQKSLTDDEILSDETKSPVSLMIATSNEDSQQTLPSPTNTSVDTVKVKHLSEIEINLDDVTPSSNEILLLDDDIKVVLNFTEDRPSLHVSVIVISIVNKSKLPVTDFHFEASVRKVK